MPVVGYYNGQFVDPTQAAIPIDERGHEFGDGVYEVIRVYAGKPFLMDMHMERLFASLQAVRIECSVSVSELTDLVLDAIARSDEQEATVYLQVTRGAAIRNHLFPSPHAQAGVSLVVRPVRTSRQATPGKLLLQQDERWANAYIKTINLLPNILAKQAAHDASADEALLIRDGDMIEAASSNVWFIRDNELLTAPADRFILNGITRRYVFQLASDLGLPVREKRVPYNQLTSIDAIFITGTTTEILPIDTVLTHPLLEVGMTVPNQAPHPIQVRPEETTVVWRAKDFSLVNQLRELFDNRVREFRNH